MSEIKTNSPASLLIDQQKKETYEPGCARVLKRGEQDFIYYAEGSVVDTEWTQKLEAVGLGGKVVSRIELAPEGEFNSAEMPSAATVLVVKSESSDDVVLINAAKIQELILAGQAIDAETLDRFATAVPVGETVVIGRAEEQGAVSLGFNELANTQQDGSSGSGLISRQHFKVANYSRGSSYDPSKRNLHDNALVVTDTSSNHTAVFR